MTELKTLNDLQNECIIPSEPQSYIGGVNDLMMKLKAEAIKWYKRHNRMTKSVRPDLVQDFIKHFFNLTEEDINREEGGKKCKERFLRIIDKFENKLRDNHFIMTEELLEWLKKQISEEKK